MAYATVEDIKTRIGRTLTESEEIVCAVMLEDATVIIDAFAPNAATEKKLVVSCRMVMRALGDGSTDGIPMGATQGSQAALGYTQSWTISGSGSCGELYLSKIEKQLLGLSNRIGAYSPVQEMAVNAE